MAAAKDLTGRRFGRLVAVRATKERQSHCVVWECKCICGALHYANAGLLCAGRTKSCGCGQREAAVATGRKKAIDLTGRRFGRLLAIRATGERRGGGLVWLCICKCGCETKVRSYCLRSGGTKSCGCLQQENRKISRPREGMDLRGRKFGRLVVIKPTAKRRYKSILWECKCNCGAVHTASQRGLIDGSTKSCGCLHYDTAIARHLPGVSPDDIPSVLREMINMQQKIKRKLRGIRKGIG